MQPFAFQCCLVSDWEFIQAYEWDEYAIYYVILPEISFKDN